MERIMRTGTNHQSRTGTVLTQNDPVIGDPLVLFHTKNRKNEYRASEIQERARQMCMTRGKSRFVRCFFSRYLEFFYTQYNSGSWDMNNRPCKPSSFAMLIMVFVMQVIATIISATVVGPLSRPLNFDDVRPEENNNAVVVESAIDPYEIILRKSRDILRSEATIDFTQLDSKREIRCCTFKECSPYFKIPDLGPLDDRLFNVYDICRYNHEDGSSSSEICCSSCSNVLLFMPDPNYNNPTVENPQVEDNRKSEDAEITRSQPTWPPLIPQHKPDYMIPSFSTHLLSPGLPTTSTTSQPIGTSSKKPSVTTTWPTRKPGWWITTSTTSKGPIGTNYSLCGVKNGNQDQKRIVGGKNADPGEWPWMAALFNAGRQFCGGSLIDDEHVLTAAHCVANMNSWNVARLIVHLGDYNIITNTEIPHIERRVKRVVWHRDFNFRTLHNDVALLTLSEPVEFTEQIRPVCLPSGSQLYTGETATVIGWGSLRERGPPPDILQEVSVPVWSNSECKLKYGAAAPGGIVDSFLCAGRVAKDSCSGDSGGPLMVKDDRWTQVGIVSWGIGCGKEQFPGVYTRVTHFLPWISKNLK